MLKLNANHTPGPWIVTPGRRAIYAKDALGYRAETVCRLPSDGLPANARLIAAAPQMLEALRCLHELCTVGAKPDAFYNGNTDSTGSIDEGDVVAGRVIEAARNAIKAATGEE